MWQQALSDDVHEIHVILKKFLLSIKTYLQCIGDKAETGGMKKKKGI